MQSSSPNTHRFVSLWLLSLASACHSAGYALLPVDDGAGGGYPAPNLSRSNQSDGGTSSALPAEGGGSGTDRAGDGVAPSAGGDAGDNAGSGQGGAGSTDGAGAGGWSAAGEGGSAGAAGHDAAGAAGTSQCLSGGRELGQIVYWCSKVNVHSTSEGWRTDDDCRSGCYELQLSYCAKYWPATASFEQVPVTPELKPFNTVECATVENQKGTNQYRCCGKP